MRIEVLSSPAGTGCRREDEQELRGLLGELALRGVEAQPVDPAGDPAAATSGRDAPGPEHETSPGTEREPARGSGAEAGPGNSVPGRPPEALLLVALGADRTVDGGRLSGWLEPVRSAVRAGRPVVVSGLGLDAAAAPDDVLREILTCASLVGLRDEASLAVARRSCPDHPALRVGWEDALLLTQAAAPPQRPGQAVGRGQEEDAGQEEGPGQEAPSVREPPAEPPRIVAAVGRPAGPFLPEDVAPVLAAVLDAVVHRTRGAVALLACGGTAGDEEFAADVAALLREDVRWDLADPDEAGAVVRRADYLVTTCGRAAALGLAAHAVVLPVAPDEYALRRMDGVLRRWGLHDAVVPLAALLTPGDVAWDTRAAAQQWATEAVEHRGAVRAALVDAEPEVREAAARWWDGVVGVLRGGRPPSVPGTAAAPRGVGAPVVRALRRRYSVPEVPPGRPTLAIVLRYRDRADHLGRALDGVLAQTFTDWRLVVVDDGGDPRTVDEILAQRRNELAGRVTVLHHRRPLGCGAAANRGLRAAESELVVLHDGSDPWHPVVLQGAVAHLEDPLVADDGVVVRTGGASEAGGPGRAGLPGQDRARSVREALTLTDVLDGGRDTVGPTFVYRRAVHGVLGDYDESLGAAADWEFVLRFLETFTAGLLPADALAGPEPVGGSSAARDELAVRDRRLRQWTSEHGVGLPLYLRRAVAEEAGGLHRRLDAAESLAHELLDVVRAQSRQIERLEQVVAQKGFAAFWRRVWRSVRGG